jgi:phospholipid/cholesterol/gamma-HCH transport system substrate-binding protein
MWKVSNETKVGVFAIICITLLILGYNVLKGSNIFSSTNTYYAVYDNLGGLESSNEVKINGLSVGRVTDLNFSSGKNPRIVVTISVNSNVKIPMGTVAYIASPDILSSKEIDLDLTHADFNQNHKSGDTLQSETKDGLQQTIAKEIEPLKDKTEKLLSSLDTLATAMNSVLNAQARSNLAQSLNNLNAATGKMDELLGKNEDRLSKIISNVDSITSNLSRSNSQIHTVLTNFASISDTLAKAQVAATIFQAKIALAQFNSMMNKVDSGKGSLGLLVNDDKLYNNLQNATNSLNALLIDLKAHPGRYIRLSIFGRHDDK